ncbi:epoxyqueuosine reductase QueH [Permianibacter sp. IMCC34836]|uniref:epoxyqueuosine reductase QueH n=1 Tax=Permianibacter fluminis TaxID=2738515 RepID=UPI001551EF9D|nr:epoxyqueuosine reductase QueH [Permianibacter fluminis]NQD37711.1 epoxyqueuosine reductase QueH [Permianibacter fluminis]
MNKYSLDHYQRPQLDTPNGSKKLLLHSCCAPCAGEVMEAVQASGIEQTVFFYNPNIHPREEYELRKQENIRFCEKKGIPFIDADYDSDNWFDRVKGLENAPERGERCTVCFDMRFERTALFAHEHGFDLISSTLGISRWKNMEQINGCGERAAARYDNVLYWTYNWRQQGGAARMVELAKVEQFYQQEYCGCVYSLRDTNRWRLSRGRDRIKRGVKFYGKDEIHIQMIAEDSQPDATSACQITPKASA